MFISWIYIKFQKTGSGNRNPRWRRRPSWIYINGYNSSKYWRNLMKFETQVEDIMPKRKYAKPEVLDKNPRWPPPPSCFHVFSCRFVIFYPICIKFCRKMHVMVLHMVKTKTWSKTRKTRWRRPPCWIHTNRYYSAKYSPILMKFLNILFSAQHATAKSKLEALHELQYDRHHHLKKTANIISKKLSS